MMKVSSNKIGTRLMKYAALHNLVVAALFFLFIFDLTTDLKTESSQVDNKEVCFTADYSNGIHLPFDSRSTFPGSETPNENELEEEVDFDDDVKEGRHHSVGTHLAQNSLEFSRLRYRTSLQHGSGVSLIILYHSWKSYLS